MSPDDIDFLAVDVFDFLVEELGCQLDEDKDYDRLKDYLHEYLDQFIERDRNYN